ncbi:MAG TPA: hypothetical protein VFO55_10720 [Gemmatimonadaceae bacterium]|nr:hypothetical protein [Gemmatimonadaceae bacterium]
MSVLRSLGLTVRFVLAGAGAGAIAALLSLTPIWLGLTALPRDFIQGWGLMVIAVVGAICGSVVMPVYGWLLIRHMSFWRCVGALLIGAVLGENIAVPLFWSMESDVLIAGAFVGASITTIGIRRRRSSRSRPPPGPGR